MRYKYMSEYDVVIIDSGLNTESGCSTSGICIEKRNDKFLVSNILKDEIGHGTIIYTIIRKHIDAARIYVVKLNESQDTLDDSCLIAALEYIKKNICCKVINISLGVKQGDNIDKLYHVCAELAEKGVVIVSAFDNEGCYSYPAVFDCVIGVDNKYDIKCSDEFDFVENSPINILAKGNVQRLKMQDGKTFLVSGSSIACAHISSILANEWSGDFDIQKALAYLKSSARYIYPSYEVKKDVNNNFFKITNAVVFPFSKEAQAFLRFSDMLSFNIRAYYDVRQSGKVGRRLTGYYEGVESDACIMDFEQIDYTNIDTIIIGHLDELNTVSGRDYKRELIQKAVKKHINIYSFDPLDSYIDLLIDSDIKYFYPMVTSYDVPQNTFGKLYKIPKPVVGVFGTSSQQGKFSLQLALKKELEFRDYKVGTIGTEPHSLLFDFDVVFPMGYNSTVRLQNSEIVLYLNNEINKICKSDKEIVLVATQAQIVPYCCNNLLEVPSMQYHFALGTKPDAIILCINYYDEIQYIRNSMYTLIGLTDATIVAFVLYPITYANGSEGGGSLKRKITYAEFEQKADMLQKEFRIPTYLLGEKVHMSELTQAVIDFF